MYTSRVFPILDFCSELKMSYFFKIHWVLKFQEWLLFSCVIWSNTFFKTCILFPIFWGPRGIKKILREFYGELILENARVKCAGQFFFQKFLFPKTIENFYSKSPLFANFGQKYDHYLYPTPRGIFKRKSPPSGDLIPHRGPHHGDPRVQILVVTWKMANTLTYTKMR